MNYLQILGLHKEPFSTSPDPFFFYRSETHRAALARLEVALRLRRGLSVILGDVGTGKTTLARTLLRNFASQDDFEFYMVFDASFQTEFQFLGMLADLFKIKPSRRTTLAFKQAIENFLYHKNLDENKTVVLIIDEAQKLLSSVLEVLRIFLNYETNERKLIQVVLFSQLEILPKITSIRNFYDRISFKFFLRPLTFSEIHEMIYYRLTQAGWPPGKTLFTPEAVELIARDSGGLLRRIAFICHQALLRLVMYEKDAVDEALIQAILKEEKEFLDARGCYTGREVAQTH